MGGYPEATQAELIELGRLTLTSAELEELVRQFYEALGLGATKEHVSRVIRSIRDQLKDSGLPPWATTDRDKVELWLEQVLTVLDERNTHVHAFVAARWLDGKWQRLATHPKTGQSSPRDSDGIVNTVSRIKNLRDSGWLLLQGMLAEMQPGVLVKRWVNPGSAGLILLQQGDGYARKPTPDEVYAYWSAWDRGFVASARAVAHAVAHS